MDGALIERVQAGDRYAFEALIVLWFPLPDVGPDGTVWLVGGYPKGRGSVGIRALRQNASAVVAEAAAGDIVVITDRGRPVAMLVPYKQSRVQALLDAGLAAPPARSIRDLPPPAPLKPGQGPLTEVLREMRDEERY